MKKLQNELKEQLRKLYLFSDTDFIYITKDLKELYFDNEKKNLIKIDENELNELIEKITNVNNQNGFIYLYYCSDDGTILFDNEKDFLDNKDNYTLFIKNVFTDFD